MFAYRVGAPGWKSVARLGLPLKALVEIQYDKDAQVWIASCEDFLPVLGIATEAETTEQLRKRLELLFKEALTETFKAKRSNKVSPIFELAPSA